MFFYAYIHESSTQDAPALRTRDGGLKIFYDWSTLPSHPVPQTLMHNDLHCVFSYIPWVLSTTGSLQNCVSARQLLLKYGSVPDQQHLQFWESKVMYCVSRDVWGDTLSTESGGPE